MYLKIVENMSKKLIICYTGEPRSLIKGLQSRNKMLSERYFSDFFIESRYLICFLRKNKKNRFKIFNRSNLFHKDNNLKKLRIEERKSKNIWEHIIQQKYDILHELKKDLNKKDDSTILLTRTDWFFTKNCLNLINLSIKKQKVITPYFSEKIELYKRYEYKAIFDQFMVIPGLLLDDVINALGIALKVSKEQPQDEYDEKIKNLYLGGNGKKRFGLAPESLLGIGFEISKLSQKHIVEGDFIFKFEPDMYGANKHNLIRDDAYIWMNLSLGDFLKKYLWHIKSKFLKFFN